MTLTVRNAAAFRHWQECRAVGQFPDDPLVRANAALIQSCYDQAEQLRQDRFERTILAALGVSGGR